MSLQDWSRALRTGWWVVVACVLVTVTGAALMTYLSTPLYSSSTRLFVSTASTDSTSAAYQGNLFTQQRVTSYAELLTQEQLAATVVDDLGLDMSPAAVAGEVSATVVPDTVILDVTVTDVSAERAQAIAQSLSRQFAAQVTTLETPPGATSSAVTVTTVQDAQLSTRPISPDTTQNLAIAVGLGLLLGVGLAALRQRLDNTVRTAEDVAALAESGVIGVVLEDAVLADEHLLPDRDRHSISAESYRAIRTNLKFLNVDRPPAVIVISSSVPGEGKSTLAVNLAVVLSQSGSRVALLEADLRRPRVTSYMGLPSGAGLSNVLAGTALLDEVIQPWGDGRLSVLAAGPMPPFPSELLGSVQMRELLGRLRAENDYVIIDAPPLLPVTDAAVLSVLADGCVLSVHHGRTKRTELVQAAAALRTIDATLLGVVLNRVPTEAGAAYGYGHGYGYEADAARRSATSTAAAPPRAPQRTAAPRVPAVPPPARAQHVDPLREAVDRDGRLVTRR